MATVQQELRTQKNTDDQILQRVITAASRAIDRKCTGVPDAVNYFMLETVTGERLNGQVDYMGQSILTYPHKPIITAVSAFAYQQNITTLAYSVDPSRIDLDGPKMQAYPTGMPVDFPSRCRIITTYTGGLSGSTAALPDDLQDACAMLAIRYYREEESGLSDAVGVAELAQMIYTKAWPVRVIEGLQPYIRRVGWRHVA